MAKRNFTELLAARRAAGFHLCVGLDPAISYEEARQAPAGPTTHLIASMERVVSETAGVAAAFKPNLGFWLRHSWHGLRALHTVVHTMRHSHPGVPIILDGKFGDIGNSSQAYADFAFDALGVDAVTVNPYIGFDGLEPFLARADKGVIVLCRTSNPGSGELQDIRVELTPEEREAWKYADHISLFRYVAHRATDEWNRRGNTLLVVGATHQGELASLRARFPEMDFLVPGVGGQGGSASEVVDCTPDDQPMRMLINVSGKICNSSDPGAAAKQYHDEITAAVGALAT